MLAVLDLFDAARPVLTAEEILERLDYSRPTGYRYVRELVSAGLLVRSPEGYAPGPRIIELDWHIRTHDPVLTASAPAVRALARSTRCGVTQMGLYGDHIVTIRYEPGPEPLEIDFDRGRPMPRFRGAPSKAVLAFLPRARLVRMYRRHAGQDLDAFLEEMQAIRAAGHAVSHGELDRGKVGVGAPVMREGRHVVGSVCLVLTDGAWAMADQAKLAARLIEATRRIGEALDREGG